MVKDKIPGWFWLTAGISMAVYAQVVLARAETMISMNFFFYIGLLFIAIGVFKVVIKKILSKPSKETKKIINDNVRDSKFVIIHCSKCNAKNYDTFNYCQNCGCKLN